MPLTGWFCVHNLVKIFNVFEPFIPWIAFVCAIIIAVVTYVICMAGVYIGKIFGTGLACKASMFGGVILILIGLEILITGII